MKEKTNVRYELTVQELEVAVFEYIEKHTDEKLNRDHYDFEDLNDGGVRIIEESDRFIDTHVNEESDDEVAAAEGLGTLFG